MFDSLNPEKTKAAYSGFPFGASFSLLASRAHIPIDKYLKYNVIRVKNQACVKK